MDMRLEQLKYHTRRQFFQRCTSGVGALALGSLIDGGALSSAFGADAAAAHAANPLAPKPPHFPAKAKNVIYLHMAGSPSQLDLFDYKPKLKELNGQECPESLFKKERFAFIKGTPKMLGTPHTFSRHGQCEI